MKYILDTGMGTELQERGINVPDWKQSIWSADALIHDPQSVREIHLANIEAGSNVIITNNYYVTPNILKRENLESDFTSLVQRSIDLANDAKSGHDGVIIAGSFLQLKQASDQILLLKTIKLLISIMICWKS